MRLDYQLPSHNPFIRMNVSKNKFNDTFASLAHKYHGDMCLWLENSRYLAWDSRAYESNEHHVGCTSTNLSYTTTDAIPCKSHNYFHIFTTRWKHSFRWDCWNATEWISRASNLWTIATLMGRRTIQATCSCEVMLRQKSVSALNATNSLIIWHKIARQLRWWRSCIDVTACFTQFLFEKCIF